jgi:hypothetical protein
MIQNQMQTGEHSTRFIIPTFEKEIKMQIPIDFEQWNLKSMLIL